MATSTPALDQTTDLGIKSEVVTYATYAETKPDGLPDTDKPITVTSRESAWAKLEAPGPNGEPPKATLFIKQPIKVPSFGSIQAFLDFFGADTETALQVINVGVGSKLSAKIATNLKAIGENGQFSFEPTETAYDSSEWLREPAKRVVMSEQEKALKAISKLGLPESVLASILENLRKAQEGIAE